MSDKPFVAEACPPMLHAPASNGLSDIETPIKYAPCNRPLSGSFISVKLRFHHHIFATNLVTTRSQTQTSEFVATKFGLLQTSDWQTWTNCAAFVCEATSQASLSAILLQKCDGGNAPLVITSLISYSPFLPWLAAWNRLPPSLSTSPPTSTAGWSRSRCQSCASSPLQCCSWSRSDQCHLGLKYISLNHFNKSDYFKTQCKNI
jgi:hypothetical protein